MCEEAGAGVVWDEPGNGRIDRRKMKREGARWGKPRGGCKGCVCGVLGLGSSAELVCLSKEQKVEEGKIRERKLVE